MEAIDQTETDLEQAFWILFAHKGVDRISIRELTTLAGYNRSTFYLHYRDIYDLLEQAEDALLAQVADCVSSCAKRLRSAEPIVLMQEVLALYERNRDHLVILLGDRGDAAFVRQLKDLMKRIPIWRVSTDTDGRMPEEEYDLLLEQTVSGVLYMIMGWLSDPRGVSAERLLHLIYDSSIRR